MADDLPSGEERGVRQPPKSSKDDPAILSLFAPIDLVDAPHRLILRTVPPVLSSYSFFQDRIVESMHTPRYTSDSDSDDDEVDDSGRIHSRVMISRSAPSRSSKVHMSDARSPDSPVPMTGLTLSSAAKSFFHCSPLTTLRDLVDTESEDPAVSLDGPADVIDRRPERPSADREREAELMRMEERERTEMRSREIEVTWHPYRPEMGKGNDVEEEGEVPDAKAAAAVKGVLGKVRRKRKREEREIAETDRSRKATRVLEKYVRMWIVRKKLLRMQKLRRDRQYVALEILETERKYHQKMTLFLELFSKKLLSEGFGPIAKSIFGGDFRVILGTSEQIMKMLSDVFYVPGSDREFDFQAPIGSQLLKIASFLKVYKRFAGRHEAVSKMIAAKRKSSSKFHKVVLELETDPRSHGTPLGTYLIEPIQRMVRYPLLLKELIKKTDPGNSDYDQLVAALKVIQVIAKDVDQSVTEFEKDQYMKNLRHTFVRTPRQYDVGTTTGGRSFVGVLGAAGLLETPGKKGTSAATVRREELLPESVLYEGLPPTSAPSTKSAPKEMPRLHIHVFTTSMVFSRPLVLGKSGRVQLKYKFRSEIGLKDVRVDVPSDPTLNRSLCIVDVHRELREVITCPSPKARRLFLGCLQKTVPQIFKKGTSTIRGSIRDGQKGRGSPILEADLSPEGIAIACPVAMTKQKCLEYVQEHKLPLVHLSPQGIVLRYCSISGSGTKLLYGDEKGGAEQGGGWAIDKIEAFARGMQTSDAFKMYAVKASSLMGVSLSLVFSGERTLDFICATKRDFVIWTRALGYIAEAHGKGIRGSNEDAEHPPKDRDLFTWGENQHDCLGHGIKGHDLLKPLVVRKFMLLDVATVSLGMSCTYVVLESGMVLSWGNGRYGKLGHGTAEGRSTPTLIHELKDRDISQVACGDNHTLFLERTGRVWSCGYGHFGQLGIGINKEAQNTPFRIAFFARSRASSVAAGGDQSAAITKAGDLYCWGKNSDGQLGHGDTVSRSTPTLVEFPEVDCQISSVAMGQYHSMAVTTKGRVFVWGSGADGQLGNGKSGTGLKRLSPLHVKLPEKIREIDCGSQHCAAIAYERKIYIWGGSTLGQTGLGASAVVATPTVLSLKIFRGMEYECLDIACGHHHNIALFNIVDPLKGDRNAVVSWGYGTDGRLGLGTAEDKNEPCEVEFFLKKEVVSVHAGPRMTGAICRHDTVSLDDVQVCMAPGCTKKISGRSLFKKKCCHCAVCRGIFCKGCCVRVRLPIVKKTPLANGRVCPECKKVVDVHFQPLK